MSEPQWTEKDFDGMWHPRPINHARCVICGAQQETDNHRLDTSSCIYSGGDITISFGFGSSHDTDCLTGVICDDCGVQMVKNAKAPFTFCSALGMPWENSEVNPEYEAAYTKWRQSLPHATLDDLKDL